MVLSLLLMRQHKGINLCTQPRAAPLLTLIEHTPMLHPSAKLHSTLNYNPWIVKIANMLMHVPMANLFPKNH